MLTSFRSVFTLAIVFTSLRVGNDVGTARNCTSGFMSVDRMDILLGNGGSIYDDWDNEGIFPETQFTCNGSVVSWVFGAEWKGNSRLFSELQIWRPVNGDGRYTRVGRTSIRTSENISRLYQYPLSSPLAFKVGDVLGYYQPHRIRSQLRLLFEKDPRRTSQLEYYYDASSSGSSIQFDIDQGKKDTNKVILVDVVTDPPGCGRGFMSVERMRLLLNLDSTSEFVQRDSRQQITPDMLFLCDGMITRWIIGAKLEDGSNDVLYPELQVWRKSGIDVYQKINGTPTDIVANRNDGIFFYSVFPPIPVKSGDILGIFVPPKRSSRVRLLSETVNSPINYYLSTGEASSSPNSLVDTQNVQSSPYHPLVSAEIEIATQVTSSSTASDTVSPSTLDSRTVAAVTPEGTPTLRDWSPYWSNRASSRTQVLLTATLPTNYFTTTPVASSVPREQNREGEGPNIAIYLSPVYAVIAAVVIILPVAIFLRWKTKKNRTENDSTSGNDPGEPINEDENDYIVCSKQAIPATTRNPAYGLRVVTGEACYGSRRREMKMSDNISHCGSALPRQGETLYYSAPLSYDPILPGDCISAAPNKVYGAPDIRVSNSKQPDVSVATNQAYGAHDVPVSTNQAYGAHDVPVSTNQAYGAHDVPVSTNQSYGAHDVPVSTNQAYGAHDVPAATNMAYGTPDVPTATNQAYGICNVPVPTNEVI